MTASIMALPSNSGWAWLPRNLLDLILDNLAPIEDCIRFGAVCTHWRYVASEEFQHKRVGSRHYQPPLMIVSTPENAPNSRSLFDVRRNSLYKFVLKMPYNRSCCGSSHGWLILLDDSFKVILFHPFSEKVIHLPVLERLAFRDEMSFLPKDFFLEDNLSFLLRKGVLSADPNVNPDEYILMIIYGCYENLAFIKSGDKDWTYIDKKACDFDESEGRYLWNLIHIIYSNGLFYAMDKKGLLFSFDVSRKLKMKKVTSMNAPIQGPSSETYLVESLQGDIWFINIDRLRFTISKFEIYELVDSCANPKWTKVNSLGDVALFLGAYSYSTCVKTSDSGGYFPNTIYIWDRQVVYRTKDLNDGDIFFTDYLNLVDEDFRLSYLNYHNCMPLPIWISPTFM